MKWHRVYDFSSELDKIAQLQAVSLDRSDYGLTPDPLVGSAQWWDAIETGRLASVDVDGVIDSVFWGSMADWPEVRIAADDGQNLNWTREGDPRRYAAGLRIKLRYALHPWKPLKHKRLTTKSKRQEREYLRDSLGDSSKVALTIDVEESNLRSPWTAPGPGGHGFEMVKRQRGAALHFVDCTNPDQIERLSSAAARLNATIRGLPSGAQMLGFPSADEVADQREQLRGICMELGCEYDGGEVVGGDAWPAERMI